MSYCVMHTVALPLAMRREGNRSMVAVALYLRCVPKSKIFLLRNAYCTLPVAMDRSLVAVLP